jgi:serine/threonine-protein kinase
MPFASSAFVRNGKYALVRAEPIGVGGLGQVFHARELRLGREVAVKEVVPTLDPLRHAQASEKFRHEAQLHARLTHPQIVPARTLELDLDTGEQYLVCDYIAGGSLADALRQGPLPLETALRVALDLLAALDYLHACQLVHQDLKPSNVLLARNAAGQIERALLADFGCCQQMGGTPGLAGPALAPALTPEYCAPEQLGPAPLALVDGRADLYALGLVLGEMLIARGPLKLARQLQEPGPSDVRWWRRAVGADSRSLRLRAIVLKATADDPARRYAQARALREELRVLLAQHAARPSLVGRLGASLAGLSVALFGALVLSLALGARAPQPEVAPPPIPVAQPYVGLHLPPTALPTQVWERLRPARPTPLITLPSLRGAPSPPGRPATTPTPIPAGPTVPVPW